MQNSTFNFAKKKKKKSTPEEYKDRTEEFNREVQQEA